MNDFTHEQFLIILDKFQAGTASAEEIELLRTYYNAFENRQDVIKLLNEHQLHELEQDMKKEIDFRIDHHIRQRRITRRRKFAINMAAAAAVLAVVSVLVFQSGVITNRQVPDTINKIAKTDKGNIMELPDGSVVILNPGSKIDYAPSFDGKSTREVYLTGEAYFDVKQIKGQPFIVHTGKLITTVLGTAFNIRALHGDSNIIVTVTRGKVKLADAHQTLAVLERDEQLVYHKKTETAVQESVIAENEVTWKQEDLLLDNVTMLNASAIIEERFKVTINITDSILRNQRFTTSLGKDDSLETIVKSMALFNDASYKIDAKRKHIVISPVTQ